MDWRLVANNTWVQYGVLSLVVMLPLLLPGYILTLDLVFTPHLPWPTEISNTYVFEALLHGLTTVIPGDVVEKILLILVLLLSGVGAHKLFTVLFVDIGPKSLYWGAYFAGIFYVINPFVYSRFMAGQYLVLLGYALTPFFVLALIKLIKVQGWRSAIWLAVLTSIIIGVSLHHAGILLLVTACIAPALIWAQPSKHKKPTAFGLVAAAGVVLINAYWLLPTMFGGSIAQATTNFSSADFQAFATNGQGVIGAISNVLRLQGFWLEVRDVYVLPQYIFPVWGVLMLAVWVLVARGAVGVWRYARPLAIALACMCFVAIILATTPLVQWAAAYVPFVAGYREPQKFVGLLALGFALFGGVGVALFMDSLARMGKKIVVSLAGGFMLVLPILCTPTMLWGFNGQLAPKDYPKDWFAVNEQLANDRSVSKVLFLPWHQYINFGFSGRIIANPASKFFTKQTVVGDNPEYKGISPTVPNATNRFIEQEVLGAGNTAKNLGKTLADLGFSHVILAKEYDYENYGYLNNQTDLALISETENLKVYAVLAGGE
jgi:hypothetical protein